jgi:hypothetical protein
VERTKETSSQAKTKGGKVLGRKNQLRVDEEKKKKKKKERMRGLRGMRGKKEAEEKKIRREGRKGARSARKQFSNVLHMARY